MRSLHQQLTLHDAQLEAQRRETRAARETLAEVKGPMGAGSVAGPTSAREPAAWVPERGRSWGASPIFAANKHPAKRVRE